MIQILIIEEDPEWRKFLSNTLVDDCDISFWPNETERFEKLNSKHYNLVILDLHIKTKDPFDLLKWLRFILPHSPVIATGRSDKTELVVRAIRNGAADFIAKPFIAEKIRLAIQKAMDSIELKGEIDYLRHRQDFIYDFDRVIAFSPVMKDIVKVLKRYAKTDTSILVTGETGTGKSFLSGSIHFNSRRRNKPFVVINCSNIPDNLLESELFGHEKGAFTGADRLRTGRFEQARGGTVFLDEIGDLSLALQGKLLRVLEEKSFERVGGNRTIRSDIRILAATNKVLENQITAGYFREDLYYRINALTVHLPPLRARKECIEPLSYLLLEKACRSLRKQITGFSPRVIQLFKSYAWPGNIRQLANVIERAAIHAEDPVIQRNSLSISVPADIVDPSETDRPPGTLKKSEEAMIRKALGDALWIQKDAAETLGISPRSLNYKIKKLGITHPRWRKHR